MSPFYFLHLGTEVRVPRPYTRTLSIGHHALVVGHVTALAGNSQLHLWYLCCVAVSPPPLWSCGFGGPVHVVLVVR